MKETFVMVGCTVSQIPIESFPRTWDDDVDDDKDDDGDDNLP